MAKKRTAGGNSKSDAIRQYLQEHPDATAKDIVPALAQQGIVVSEGLVSVVRSSLKKRAGKKATKKKVGRNGRVSRRAATATGEPARGARSQAIRDYLAQSPGASSKEVVAGLQAKGIEVKETLVNSIKYGKRSKALSRKRIVSRGRPGRATGTLTSDDLLEAKRLADQLGGIKQARQALETLERLR